LWKDSRYNLIPNHGFNTNCIFILYKIQIVEENISYKSRITFNKRQFIFIWKYKPFVMLLLIIINLFINDEYYKSTW